MKKKLSFLLMLLLCPFVDFAQEGVIKKDSTVTKEDHFNEHKNLFAVDINFFSLSLEYARKINKKWFMGIGGEWGQAVNVKITGPIYMGNIIWEGASINIKGKYLLNMFMFDVGVKGYIFLYNYLPEVMDENISGGYFIGGYCTIMYGYKYVKLGHSVSIGNMTTFFNNKSNIGGYVTPLFIRITFPY